MRTREQAYKMCEMIMDDISRDGADLCLMMAHMIKILALQRKDVVKEVISRCRGKRSKTRHALDLGVNFSRYDNCAMGRIGITNEQMAKMLKECSND